MAACAANPDIADPNESTSLVATVPGPAVLNPVADAYVWADANPTVNYGAATNIFVKDGNTNDKHAFLKFDLTSVKSSPITSAKLRVYGSSVATTTIRAHGCDSDSWTEAGITWTNQPAYEATVLSTVATTTTAKYYEWDVTSYVRSHAASGDGVATLVLDSGVKEITNFTGNSRENGSNRPELVIATGSTPGTCSPADCNGHGTCSSGVCSCSAGYAGSGCDTCAPGYTGYPSCTKSGGGPTITVDANADYGTFLNPGKTYSTSGSNQTFSQQDKDQMATLNTADNVVKIWAHETSDAAYPDAYIIDAASRASTVLIAYNDSSKTSYTNYYNIIARAKSLLGKKFKYLEFCNEMEGGWSSTKMYEVFRNAYTAAFDYNSTIHPSVPVEVGGPATMGSRDPVDNLIRDYKTDTNSKKSLGFISQHFYAYSAASNAGARTMKQHYVDLLSSLGLPTSIPVFVTESSLFYGTTSYGSEAPDMLEEAAHLAVRGYYWVMHSTPSDRLFQWVAQKNAGDLNVRKSFLDFGAGVGEGIATPYMNMIKLQLMLKSNRISNGESNNEGWGLNCFATKDSTGVAVMLMNHQRGTSTAYNAALNVINLDNNGFRGKHIRAEKYLVDSSHNNSRNRADGYDGVHLVKLNDATVAHAGSYATTEPIDKNAIELIVLTPVP